jgi:hypothetical protein
MKRFYPHACRTRIRAPHSIPTLGRRRARFCGVAAGQNGGWRNF